jgi:hypothetical protein
MLRLRAGQRPPNPAAGAMIGRLRSHIEHSLGAKARSRARRERFKAWLAQNPGSTYAHFYIHDTYRTLQAGGPHATLGTTNVDEGTVRRRARNIVADLKRAGCTPQHVVVDYGCGSLWVGEALMAYLAPGNYIGLDVADLFYKDGLARLSAAFVAGRRPVLRVIDEASLAEARDRRPDFIFSAAVMQHVPPGDLAGYFSRIASMAGPHTRIEICSPVVLFPWTRWRNRHWHTRFSGARALAPLGYAAEYRAERRLMRMRGFSMVRR